MILLDFLLKLFVWFHQGFSLSFDLVQQSLVFVLFFVQFSDFISQLFYQIQVCRCDLCVVCFDVRVFLGMLSCQFLYLVILLVLQLLNHLFAIVLHLWTDFLHFQVILFLQICGFSFKFLPEFSLPFIILCLKCKSIVLLRNFLLFKRYMECSDISLKSSFLDPVLIFQLFQSHFHIFS